MDVYIKRDTVRYLYNLVLRRHAAHHSRLLYILHRYPGEGRLLTTSLISKFRLEPTDRSSDTSSSTDTLHCSIYRSEPIPSRSCALKSREQARGGNAADGTLSRCGCGTWRDKDDVNRKEEPHEYAIKNTNGSMRFVRRPYVPATTPPGPNPATPRRGADTRPGAAITVTPPITTAAQAAAPGFETAKSAPCIGR